MIPRPQPRATFEPPRAGATRGVWNAWFAFLRRSRLRVPRLPFDLRFPALSWEGLAVVLIPIYGWLALGKRGMARWAAIGYGVSLVIAIVCVGWAAAGFAAGAMIAIHGLGIAEYFYSGQVFDAVRHRILRSVGVVLVLAMVYTFAGRELLAAFVIPVQTDRGTVLVNSWASTKSLAAEEIVAFRSEGWRAANFLAPKGIYLGRLYAKAGGVITFQAETFAVNGIVRPRLPFMPKAGKLEVPPRQLFLWPLELRREARNPGEADDFARSMALRAVEDVTGRAYAWWFWRKNTYEPL